jgi:hypothetical protein
MQQVDVLVCSLPFIALGTFLWGPWALLAVPVGGPWWVMYVGEYLYYRIAKWYPHYAAYSALSAEREANAHEDDPMYLGRRKFLAQFRYRH